MNMKPIIIGFSGKYKSGKDTMTSILSDYFKEQGKEPIHLKFAQRLKEVTSVLTGTSVDDNFSDEGKAKLVPSLGHTLGRLQQIVGTVLRENICPDIWVKVVTDQILPDSNKVYIISDVRFPNEARELQKLGGKVIRLNRKTDSNDGRDPKHISETALDDYPDFDLIVDNNGPLEKTKEIILSFINSDLKRRKLIDAIALCTTEAITPDYFWQVEIMSQDQDCRGDIEYDAELLELFPTLEEFQRKQREYLEEATLTDLIFYKNLADRIRTGNLVYNDFRHMKYMQKFYLMPDGEIMLV